MQVAYLPYVSFSSLFDSTQNGVYSGRAGLRSLGRSVPASPSSAVSKNVHFVRKSQSSVRRQETHKLSDHLCGNCSTWAITPLCFSPPTFINFSLVVTSLTWEKIPGSPRFSVLQATESWAGPGNEAILHAKRKCSYRILSTIGNQDLVLHHVGHSC